MLYLIKPDWKQSGFFYALSVQHFLPYTVFSTIILNTDALYNNFLNWQLEALPLNNFLYIRFPQKIIMMKKIIVLLSAILISTCAMAQKKKKPVKANSNKIVLATSGNLSAELLKKKDAYRLYLLFPDAKKKLDTFSLKTAAYNPNADASIRDNNIPTNCTITPFTSKGVSLHSISWIEKAITEVPDKKEDATRTVTEIWNIATKTQLYSNVQTATKITEILYLDKGKNASQTSEKMRNEGFTLTVSGDGDLTLKNRTQENKMSYDAAENKYIAVKSAPQAPPVKSKKKK